MPLLSRNLIDCATVPAQALINLHRFGVEHIGVFVPERFRPVRFRITRDAHVSQHAWLGVIIGTRAMQNAPIIPDHHITQIIALRAVN